MEVTTCKSGKIPKVEHAITKIATQKNIKIEKFKFSKNYKITCYV